MAYQPQQRHEYANQHNPQNVQPSHEERRRTQNGQDMSYGYGTSPVMFNDHAQQGYTPLPDGRQMQQHHQWQNHHGHQQSTPTQHQMYPHLSQHQLQQQPQQQQWSHAQPPEQQRYQQNMLQQHQVANAWTQGGSQPYTGQHGFNFQHSMSPGHMLSTHAQQADVSAPINLTSFHHNHSHTSPSMVPTMAGLNPYNINNGFPQTASEAPGRQSYGQVTGQGYDGASSRPDDYSNIIGEQKSSSGHFSTTNRSTEKRVPVSTKQIEPAYLSQHAQLATTKHASGFTNRPTSSLASVQSSSSATNHAFKTATNPHDDQLYDVIHVSPKRRKSNEGVAIPAAQRQSHSAVQHVKPSNKTVSSPSAWSQPKAQLTPQQVPKEDHSDIFLALADEYIHAAHGMSLGLTDPSASDDDLRQYQRLIATAISCLDSALHNHRYTDQRKAALIRLRLASLIYEETTSTDDAEEVLSKGMALCDSSRLYDLKYAMQHMFVRNLHNSNAKAALKALDKSIKDVETLKLRHWQYAFHLLKVSLCMRSGGFSDLAAAHKHLRTIAQLADDQADTSVKIVTSALEAICHLRGGTSDDFGSATYAIAVANGSQLSDEMKAMPQAQALINCLNMIDSVPRFSSDAMFTAMRQMHPEQNTLSKAKEWTKDGVFAIPLRSGLAQHAVSDSYGVFVESNGRLALNVKWMTSAEMMILCYVLSGIGSIPKNAERFEAERFFSQALKINNLHYPRVNAPLHTLLDEHSRRRQVSDSIKYLQACALAARAQYGEALKIAEELSSTFTETPRQFMQDRLRFIRGMCEQGLGHLEAALELFHIDPAQLQPEAKVPPILKDLNILSTLNSIHIMHQLQRPASEIESLLDLLESPCLDHVNRNFKAAYHVVVATIGFGTSTIIDTKNRLSHALQPAQGLKNQQLLAIIMNMMTEIFFTDIVGAQSQKSAHAAHTIAAKSGDPLWTAVGLGMYRETLERMGEVHKASDMDVLMQKAVSSIPPDVQRALTLT